MIASLADRYLAERRLTTPTIKAWRVLRYHLKILTEFLEAEEIDTPSQLTFEVMARFQNALFYRITKYGKPTSPGFQCGVLGTVRCFARYLLRENFLLLDPTVTLQNPRTRRRLPTGGLTQVEAESLLAAPVTDTPLGCRDRAMLEVLYATGIRAGELLAAKLADLDLAEAILRIRAGKNQKDRVVPMGRSAVSWCRYYLDTVRPFFPNARIATVLFLSHNGKPLTNTILNEHLAEYAKQAGIQCSISAHTMRHTCATLMLKAGCDIRYIQALLGHSSLVTTQLYTRVEIGDLATAHARFHPRSFSRQLPPPPSDRYTGRHNPWQARYRKRAR